MSNNRMLSYSSETFACRDENNTRNLEEELDECKEKIRKLEKMASQFKKVGLTNLAFWHVLGLSCIESRFTELGVQPYTRMRSPKVLLLLTNE